MDPKTTSSEPSSSPTDEWMELQRKYWDTWSELRRQALGSMSAETTPANTWADALDHWWKAMSPHTPSDIEDFYTRLIEQGKTFLRLSEGLGSALRSATPGGQSLLDWQQQIEKALAGIREALSGSAAETQGVMRQVMAFWEMPFDTWQRTASSMSVLPGDFLQNLRSEELERIKPALEGGIDRLLSIPGVGYTREWQEQLQTHGRLWLDYQKAYQQYVAGYSKIGMRCIEQLEDRLMELLKQDKAITALRELYDLWIDCCEEVYGEYVTTDEYAELRADLVNNLMALKHHGSAMVDELLGAMSMPTEREIRTLQQRLQETRRDGKALRTELQDLKEQVAQLLRRQDTGKYKTRTTVVETGGKRHATATPKAAHAPHRKKNKPTAAANRRSKQQPEKGG